MCTHAGASVVWIIGYTYVGQLCSVGVVTLGTVASAGVNQGGSVEGNEVQQRVLPGIPVCVPAWRDFDVWDCGWQSVSGCDFGSLN